MKRKIISLCVASALATANVSVFAEHTDTIDNPFVDTYGKWYESSVAYVYSAGIINGVSSSEFAPEKNVSRAELATMLYRIVSSAECLQKNTYNNLGYIDVSGNTIEDIVCQMDMTLEEFLEEYDLPSNMPKNTNETVAFYTIPVSRMAEMYGMDFATMKEILQWGDEITETSTWGDAEGATKVGIYVGEENLDNFKEYYGLGDEVTADTLWKDIRNAVDQVRREERIATENEDMGNSGEWYASAQKWVEENDIMDSIVTDNSFDAQKALTREEIMVMIYNTYKISHQLDRPLDTTLDQFTDAQDISDYAQQAVLWTVDNEIIQGDNMQKLNPQDNVTRAETAAILQRYLTKFKILM